jgi:Ca2+-transporting ATPase
VELGRGLYDNLSRYIRFQMGCLFGFIISFLGAAIFNIAGGVPFLPLQTLWVNFTAQIAQAVGLGYGKPAVGLMGRKPRQPGEPILSRGLISWAEQAHNKEIAHTMGLVTFSLYNLFFSLAVKDEHKTVFSLDTLSDKVFIKACGVSILTIILATAFGPLQRFLETTSLDVQQWLICIGVALPVIVASEIRKAVRRRNHPRMGDDMPSPAEQYVGT